jgi:hypothetical protein
MQAYTSPSEDYELNTQKPPQAPSRSHFSPINEKNDGVGKELENENRINEINFYYQNKQRMFAGNNNQMTSNNDQKSSYQMHQLNPQSLMPFTTGIPTQQTQFYQQQQHLRIQRLKAAAAAALEQQQQQQQQQYNEYNEEDDDDVSTSTASSSQYKF